MGSFMGWKKATLPTWDNVGAWRWLLCKWSSKLAISGAGAVTNPNLRPLLITFENESSLITLPSVSNDKNDFGSTCACSAFHMLSKTVHGADSGNYSDYYFRQSNVE